MKSRPRNLALGFMLAAGCSGATPSSAQWSTRHSLPVDRFEGYGVERDGSVFFLGGITGVIGDIRTANPSTRVDVYDAPSDTWSSGTPLPANAPKHHLTVAKSGDLIYVLSGFDGILGKGPNEPFVPVGAAYVLEGTSWRELAKPPLARGAATAQAIDGKIYVTGGAPNEGEPPFAELDIYDIATDTWTTGPSMPTAREHLASCALDGKLLAVGGWVGPGDVASHAAEWFDPKTNQWEKLPDLPTARGGLGAIMHGGLCHVIGGEDWKLPLPGTFGAHEVFDPRTRSWAAMAPMPTARHGFGLALLGDTLYAVGGGPSQGNSYTGIVEAFGP